MSDTNTPSQQEREETGSTQAGGSVAGTMPGGTTSGVPSGQGGTNTGQTDTLSGDFRVGAVSGGATPVTESTGMGGAGSSGDSATGTGAPPRAGGAGGQPIAPATRRKNSGDADDSQAHGSDETGDITGGTPRAGAAGAQEDAGRVEPPGRNRVEGIRTPPRRRPSTSPVRFWETGSRAKSILFILLAGVGGMIKERARSACRSPRRMSTNPDICASMENR
jgi:hypothetical protein